MILDIFEKFKDDYFDDYWGEFWRVRGIKGGYVKDCVFLCDFMGFFVENVWDFFDLR